MAFQDAVRKKELRKQCKENLSKQQARKSSFAEVLLMGLCAVTGDVSESEKLKYIR